MKSLKFHILSSLGVTVAAFLLIEYLWMRLQSLLGLLAVFAITVPALIWVQRGKADPAWPQPEPEALKPETKSALPLLPISLLLVAGGALFLATALALALNNHLGWTLATVVAAAACWYPLIDNRLRPVSRKWAAGLLLLALTVGSVFRLYKAGDIPMGLITVDEPRLIMYAHAILDGKRESFNITACEGQFTFYTEALAMKVFGMDIHGFRMSCVIPGIMMIGLMALLGAELAGLRLGLMAAGFTALSLWPLSFSRAEYLMASSYIPILGCLWLFLKGLRRGSPASLVLSGFCFGLCFSVYQAGKLMPLMLGLFVVLIWIHRADWRRPLAWALLPFACGSLLTLAPLLLWVVRDPVSAYQIYFAPLFAGFSAGASLMETQGFFGKLNGAVGRILPELPKVASMFTTRGGMRPWYFLVEEPVIDHATLFLFLSGLATCLVRFRRPAFAFLVFWWFIGLFPTLASNPLLNMDERRIMMSLPATLFIASLGLLSFLDICTRNFSSALSNRITLLLCLSFFTYLGFDTWKTYFHVINRDKTYLDYNHANFGNMLRAIFNQEAKAPISLITFRKPNDDNWWGSNPQNELEEHLSILHRIPRQIASTNQTYFNEGGLFGFLRNIPASAPVRRDPLIVLTPFHFYLEPLLVNQLGGVRVADVPPAMSNEGLNFKDVGFAWDKTTATRLILLKGFSPSKLDALESRWRFPYTVEEIQPPVNLGTRQSLAALWMLDPKFIQALKGYDAAPRNWHGGKSSSFSILDAWFWVTDGNFPGHIEMPLRLRASWTLNIPEDGTYSLGASANVYTALHLDGKKVFIFLAETREQQEAAREGSLGQPIFLKAGPHRLDIEQVVLNGNGNFDQVIRLLWQKPGGIKETLPIELLLPQPPEKSLSVKPIIH